VACASQYHHRPQLTAATFSGNSTSPRLPAQVRTNPIDLQPAAATMLLREPASSRANRSVLKLQSLVAPIYNNHDILKIEWWAPSPGKKIISKSIIYMYAY
jgi:hypothetical protein